MSDRWDLRERTMTFAVGIFRFCRELPRTDEARDVARQLRRCSGSVGADYRASRRGKSHRDFAAKIATVIEEADEACFWLEFLLRVELAPERTVRPHLVEADVLVRIFTAARKTARSRQDKGTRRSRSATNYSVPD